MLVTAHLLAQTQEPARVSLAAISHPDLLAEAMPYLSVQVLSDDPAIAVTVTQHGCYVFAVPLAAGQWSYLYLEIVSDSQPQLVPLLKQSELYRLHPTKQLVFHLSYVSLQNESECNQCGAHSDHPEDNPCAGFCSTAPESLALGAMVHPFTTQMSLVQSVITDPLRVNYLAPGNSFLYMEWLRVGITILKTPPAQPPVSSHLTRIAIGHANAISTLLKGPSGILGWCSFRLSHTHLVCTHCMQRYPSIRAFIAHIIPGISASILFRYAIYHIDKTMTRNPSDVERFMLEQKF